jgi:hypothetical protein
MQRLLLPGRATRAVAAADALGLVAFVLVGYSSHHDGLAAGGLARDLACFLAGWFLAAAGFGAYDERTLRPLLLTWVVGVPLAVAARALVLGKLGDAGELSFLVVALVFTAVFVAVARLLLSLRG